MPSPLVDEAKKVVGRRPLFVAFFFVVFGFLLYQLYLVFGGFLAAGIWAAILALTFYPGYEAVLRRTGQPTIAAVVMTFGIYLMVVIPSMVLLVLLVGQASSFYATAQSSIADAQTNDWMATIRTTEVFGVSAEMVLEDLPKSFRDQIDLRALALRAARSTTELLAVVLGSLLRNSFHVTVSFFLTMFILFFFFRDGEKLLRDLREALPMERRHKDVIFTRLYDTISAVVQSMVVTAFAQGLLCGVAFWGVGLPFALLLGVAAGLASFIPFGGPAIVWLPAVGYFLVLGSWGKAAFVLLWGAGVVGLVDNLLKPWILGDRTQIPTLFLFLGLIGGLQAYGVLGIFLGPTLLALFVGFYRIYRDEYRGAAGPAATEPPKPAPAPPQPSAE